MAHEPARGAPPPVDRATARALTTALGEAIGDVRQAVGVLAERVRAAYQARVWTVLGYQSWADYVHAEFGISRAQAYRLIDISRAAGALTTAIRELDVVSPTGDTGVDLGLSGRALRAVAGHLDDVIEQVTDRLNRAFAAEGGPVPAAAVRDIVREVVEDVRRRPVPHPRTDEPAEAVSAEVAAGRKIVEELYATREQIGLILLELAPGFLSEQQAAEQLAEFCDEIGEDIDVALACRRYALTGDRRAFDGVG